MGGLNDGWEGQGLVLGVSEYRARHRRSMPERTQPVFPRDVCPTTAVAPVLTLRVQVERVLLLFDEVEGCAEQSPAAAVESRLPELCGR
jgi:hypothetical protein